MPAEVFILVLGRSGRPSTALNEGKFTPGYTDTISSLFMGPAGSRLQRGILKLQDVPVGPSPVE